MLAVRKRSNCRQFGRVEARIAAVWGGSDGCLEVYDGEVGGLEPWSHFREALRIVP